MDDVGAAAGLDRRGDARLQVVAVDGFHGDLEPERLFGFGQQFTAQQRVGGGNEIAEPQPMQGRGLREGRRTAARQNAGKAAGGLEKRATIDARHGSPPENNLLLGVDGRRVADGLEACRAGTARCAFARPTTYVRLYSTSAWPKA
jgi:hypothetical protein